MNEIESDQPQGTRFASPICVCNSLKGKYLGSLEPNLATGAFIARPHWRMARLQTVVVEQDDHFRDRLGDRRLRKDGTGDTVEVFRLCRELGTMRLAITDRVTRLATLRLAQFVPVRRAAVPADDSMAFEIISDHVPGARLSDMLEAADAGRVVVSTEAAIHVVRQLLGALAALHESRAVTHGAIAPERLIVTPRGHLFVADCALGLALERLNYSRAKLWREFRIPMPPGADPAQFDQQADIAQVGLVAVALLAGRPLKAVEYPGRLLSLVDSLGVPGGGSARVPISKALAAWLRSVLPVKTWTRFATARDAQVALENALSKRRRPASAENPLKALFDDYDRVRTDGKGNTVSTTGRVESLGDVNIPTREQLRPAFTESPITNPGGVGPDPLPAFMLQHESPVRQSVPEQVRADNPVIPPVAVPVLRQPGPAAVLIGDTARPEPVGVSQTTRRTALGASHGVARADNPVIPPVAVPVLRQPGPAAVLIGDTARPESAGVSQTTRRTALGASHGVARAWGAFGHAVGAAGRAVLFVPVRVARGTARVADAIGAATVDGLARAWGAFGHAVGAAGRAVLFVPVRVARGTARVAYAIGTATVDGLARGLGAFGRVARATGAASIVELARGLGTIWRTADRVGGATVHGLARGLGAFGRALGAAGRAILFGSVPVALGTARVAYVIGAATAHGLARAVGAFGRVVGAAGRAVLFVPVRVARGTARVACATGATTVDELARAAGAFGRVVGAAGRAVLFVPVRVARGTARVACAIGAASVHGLAWAVSAPWRAISAAGAVAAFGFSRMLRTTGRAARVAGAAALGAGGHDSGSATDVVRHVRYPLIRRPLLLGALVVIVAWPAVQLDRVQWRGVLQGWIPVLESAAGKHSVAPVPDVGSPGAGALRVQSEPAGAQIWLDGVLKGETPLALDRVKEGAHIVVLRHASGLVRTTVRVRARETADVLVPIYSGWFTAFATAELQILDGGVVVGTTESGRILARPGDHILEFVSERLGFRATRTIEVKPGDVTVLNIELPPAPLEIVAPPGAEIWIDGQPIGTAPLPVQSVAIGTCEVVMRHPVLGEQRQTITITYLTPNRIVFSPPS